MTKKTTPRKVREWRDVADELATKRVEVARAEILLTACEAIDSAAGAGAGWSGLAAFGGSSAFLSGDRIIDMFLPSSRACVSTFT